MSAVKKEQISSKKVKGRQKTEEQNFLHSLDRFSIFIVNLLQSIKNLQPQPEHPITKTSGYTLTSSIIC